MRKNIIFIRVFILVVLNLMLVSGTKYLVSIFSSDDIEKILMTSEYSYLPTAAQNYIRDVYESTGEVILTEKNKVDNVYYLNPLYVDYLSMSTEEKMEVDVIPEQMIIDFSFTEVSTLLDEEKIPESFDLRDVNGKNYVTPIKDQGGLGLCWAFGTYGQIESLLLIQNEQTYTSDAQIFSERQIDYATANDGITDGAPFYSYNRILGDGGNFKYATSVMIDSLGMVDVSWKEYDDDDVESMEKHEVYNFDNSLYEVMSTIDYPYMFLGGLDPESSDDQLLKENYLNNLKSLIMQYGGTYISTGDPTGRCSISIDGSRFMYDDGICASAGHAMQVIGWDDNYEYNICTGTKDDKGYYHINKNVSDCEGGTVVSGKGAWILKNSWGSSSPYVYIAYDSKDMRFNLVTELGQKDWDNYYSIGNNIYGVGQSQTIGTFTKKSHNKEQLNKIKFTTGSQNATYKVYIATDSSQSFTLYSTITSEFPGVHTVDLTDENIYFEDDKFYVKIVASSGTVNKGISVYTDSIGDDYHIVTEDAVYDNSLTSLDKYVLRVSSDTVNIPEKEIIEYRVLDKNGKEISVDYTYSENTVFANHAFSKLVLDNGLEKDVYKLQSMYKGTVLSESNMVIDKDIVTITGSGTEDDPYLITTPAQLGLMKYDQFAYYELGNDIDLTYDTTNENGLYYNDGKGWEPIRYSNISFYSDYISASDGFSGGFDGKNHKIIGLNINRPDENAVGLFANTYNMNFSNLYIKDVILENPNIVGNNFVGGIVGYVNGTTYERCLALNNLVVNGGKISGNNYVGGVIGGLRAGSYLNNYYTNNGQLRHFINSLYSSATIEANNYAGGIFGYVTNISGYKEGNSIFQVTNLLNKGKVFSENMAGGIAGNIKTRENNYISIYNAINTGEVEGINCSGGIACSLDSSSVGNLNLSDIYYLDENGILMDNDYIKIDNVTKMTVDDLKNEVLYSDWENFGDYWKIESIDDVLRMPVLSIVDFDYTVLFDLSVRLDEEESIYSAINPDIEAAYNVVIETTDDGVISISRDGQITGLKKGSTVLSLISYYDGYIGDLTVNVTSPRIIFNSNSDEEVIVSQDIVEEAFNLKINEFTRNGYSFVGWNTERDGTGISYTDGQEVTFTNKVTLYAQWVSNTYSISYNANGGVGDMEDTVGTYGVPIDLSMNVFVKEGCTFVGWNTEKDGTGISYTDGQEVTFNKSTILYAQWSLNKYAIVFDANGGEGSMSDLMISYNVPINLKNNEFTREGHTFARWNTEKDGTGTSYEDGQEITVTQGLKLYAQWNPNTYSISYDANGGNGTMSSASVSYGDVYTLSINMFTRTGYTFTGWNTEKDGTGTSYSDSQWVIIKGELKLYAQWSPNTYTIIFNANGGFGIMSNISATYDETVHLTNNKYINGDLLFKEWNTKKDGTGSSYANGAEVKNLATSGNITLFAIWEDDNIYKGSKYTFDEKNKTIDLVPANTSLNEFKKNIDVSDGYELKIDLNGKSSIYTGSKTRIYKGNVLVYEFTNIVRGDINGDGKISSLDYVKVKNHIMKSNIISGYVYEKAADANNDNKISSLDYVRIKNAIMEGK